VTLSRLTLQGHFTRLAAINMTGQDRQTGQTTDR